MTTYELDDDAPHLEPDAWIAPTATLIGRVWLSSNASVWWGAVLRGDIEAIHIGPRSNVQDLSVVHADPGFPVEVEADVTIGHRATLHGCRVGPASLVGIGASILNGAVVGERAIVGAHALVPEGKEIPPGTLAVGVPARVVRELTPEEQDRIPESAARYVQNAKRYRERLRRL